MKFNFLMVLTLLVSISSAFAGQKAPRSPFEALKKDASDAYDTLTDFECRPDCITPCFTFEQRAEGFAVTAHDRELAELVVSDSDAASVKLSEKRESDGSFQRKYAVPGVGTITFTYADDAYYSVSIDDGNQTETCSQEF